MNTPQDPDGPATTGPGDPQTPPPAEPTRPLGAEPTAVIPPGDTPSSQETVADGPPPATPPSDEEAAPPPPPPPPVAQDDDERKPVPGWVWALLALLLLLLLLWLVPVLTGDDEADDVADPGVTVTETSTRTETETSSPQDTEASPDAPETAPEGEVLAGQDVILPIPRAGLEPYEGEAVRASSVAVSSVPADEGFWVGDGRGERLYVVIDVNGESPRDLEAGQRIAFQGRLRALSGELPPAANLTDEEGLDEVRELGFYIQVPRVTIVQR